MNLLWSVSYLVWEQATLPRVQSNLYTERDTRSTHLHQRKWVWYIMGAVYKYMTVQTNGGGRD